MPVWGQFLFKRKSTKIEEENKSIERFSKVKLRRRQNNKNFFLFDFINNY